MEEIKLYNNQETLFFDSVAHQYFWNDEQLPSATTICKLLTPANVIGNWTSKICAEEFKKLIKAGKSYDEIEIEQFYEQIKKSANKNMSTAGLVGSQVHNLIENYIHTQIVPEIHNEMIRKSFTKFKEWYDKQENLTALFTERKVLSRKYKFCGTVDGLFKNEDNYILFDWKTSSGIRDSYFVQCYLYAIALEEELGITIPKGVIVNCTKDNKLNVKEFLINKEMQDIAINCLNIYRYLNKKEKKNEHTR